MLLRAGTGEMMDHIREVVPCIFKRGGLNSM